MLFENNFKAPTFLKIDA